MKNVIKWIIYFAIALALAGQVFSARACIHAETKLAEIKARYTQAELVYKAKSAELQAEISRWLAEVAVAEEQMVDQDKTIERLRGEHRSAMENWVYWESRYRGSQALADCDMTVKALKVDLSIKSEESDALAANLSLCEGAKSDLKKVVELSAEQIRELSKNGAVKDESLLKMEGLLKSYIHPTLMQKVGRAALVVGAFLLGVFVSGIGD